MHGYYFLKFNEEGCITNFQKQKFGITNSEFLFEIFYKMVQLLNQNSEIFHKLCGMFKLPLSAPIEKWVKMR